MKKLLALFLAAAVMLGVFPAGALAAAPPASGSCGEQLQWSYADGTLTVTGTGAMRNFDNWPPEDQAPWKPFAPVITRVILPEGLTCISPYAFYGCSALEQLTLPSTVTQVAHYAFAESGLTALELPAGAEVYTPDTFYGCTSLASVTVAPGSTLMRSTEGVLFSAQTGKMIYYPHAKPDPAYRIPDDTTEIVRNAIQNPFLKEVTVPGTMQVLSSGAFQNCPALGNVVLENGVREIGDRSFYGCTNLTGLTMPDSVERVGDEAFTRTPLMDSGWQGDLCYLGSWLLTGKLGITSCEILPGTVGIADRAFYRQPALTSVTVPDGVRFLGKDAFNQCTSLSSVQLSNTLERIGEGAFFNCKALTELTLPESLRSIEAAAFCYCGLTSLVIPQGCQEIKPQAFSDCTALESLTLPNTLTWVAGNAFENCTGLKTVVFDGTQMEWLSICQSGNPFPANVEIQFTQSSAISGTCGAEGDGSNLTWSLDQGVLTVSGTGAMARMPGWSIYRDQIRKAVVEEGVTTLGVSAFQDCSKMTEISLPESLESSPSSALDLCINLKTLHIPGALEFSGIPGIRTDSLEFISVSPENPHYAVRDGILYSKDFSTLIRYPSAKPDPSFCLPRECTAVGREAFRDNFRLKAIGIPVEFTHADASAFAWPGLTDLYYEGTVQQGEALFSGLVGVRLHCNWVYGSSMEAEDLPLRSDIRDAQHYTVWSSPVNADLEALPDGTFQRVEFCLGTVTAERYDASFRLLSRRVVARAADELPMFGGYYSGKDYNFLVFGNRNESESKSQEVMRVVRYTKDWQRLDHTAIQGANTRQPFGAGSLRMAQAGDYLYVHTCHRMFTTNDGLSHQANVILSIHIPTMELRDHFWDVFNDSTGYVSHSFNQFIAIDGDRVLTVNQGDAYPRSLFLFEYPGKAGQDRLCGAGTSSEFLQFGRHPSNYNNTGASVGGFEITDSSYLAALSAAGNNAPADGKRNLMLSVLPRGPLTGDVGTQVMLTHYTDSDPVTVSTPQTAAYHGDRVLVLWCETKSVSFSDGTLCWQITDGAGRPVSDLFRNPDGALSSCKPVISGDKAVWYVTDGSTPVFYSISLSNPEQLEIIPTYEKPAPHVHTPGTWTVSREPTCTEPGEKTSVCTGCGETLRESIPALGHKPETRWSHDASKHWHSCSVCREKLDAASHTFGPWTVSKQPTVNQAGLETRTCTVCGESQSRELPKHVHTPGTWTVSREPTCTEPGEKTSVCTGCGETLSESIPALGHKPETRWSHDASKHWHFCSICGAKTDASAHSWSPWQTVTEAAVNTPGLERRTCFCGAEEQRTIPPRSNPFTDLDPTEYYMDPILWAVDHKITVGMTPTTFEPDRSCTRAQVVTFLWRNAGCPEPVSTRNSFTDVPEKEFFYKPVLWAVENGITLGTSETTFSPNDGCSRGQVVTFLWRSAGNPQARTGRNPFADVPEDEYFYTPILWAVENGITMGTSQTTFSPNLVCSRAQIVTFLYRVQQGRAE